MAARESDKKLYTCCRLCPRLCGVNRTAGEKGLCGETDVLRLAAASLHRGEEPPVTGTGGSGTIFVSGCSLGCAFCQNWQISHNSGALGKEVSAGEFAEICLELQKRGAENINIVTGSHHAPAIASGLSLAREQGLFIPALWNSSAYDGIESLDALRDLVAVYLPDMKTLDAELARRFFHAPDYPAAAEKAILAMAAARPLRYAPGRSGSETLVSGVMVRHLVLPGYPEATRGVLRWFAEKLAGRALLSVMTQYTPVEKRREGHRSEGPMGYVSGREYDVVMGWLEEFGIEDGFCQELVTDDGWLPDFNNENPFPASAEGLSLSTPVWHWRRGFLSVPPPLNVDNTV